MKYSKQVIGKDSEQLVEEHVVLELLKNIKPEAILEVLKKDGELNTGTHIFKVIKDTPKEEKTSKKA